MWCSLAYGKALGREKNNGSESGSDKMGHELNGVEDLIRLLCHTFLV